MRSLFVTKCCALLVTMLFGHVGLSATYYVSNQGDDALDGTTPQTAWASLDRVNQGPFQPGDRILFQCNGVWRGSLRPHSGNEQASITYASYGEGQKPLLLGSASKNNAADWTDEGDGLWSAGDLPSDVGNIIFGNEELCGAKKWAASDLKQDGDYWYDRERHRVVLRMAENPAKRYSQIECALYQHVIDEGGRSYVCYEKMMLKYGGAHGIGGGGAHHIVVRNCDIGFVGGCDQYGDDRHVRFGNGIEFWATAHDIVVEGCRIWEIYDAALTNQSLGPATPQFNIIYRDNRIWNCEYSFEYWNRPEASETHDVVFENNVCLSAGGGWGHAQRPDPSGRHLCLYTSPAPAKNVVVRNNVFDGAKGNAFFAPTWSKAQVDALAMDDNRWWQPEGIMIRIAGVDYPMAEFARYQAEWNKEPNSKCMTESDAKALLEK